MGPFTEETNRICQFWRSAEAIDINNSSVTSGRGFDHENTAIQRDSFERVGRHSCLITGLLLPAEIYGTICRKVFRISIGREELRADECAVPDRKFLLPTITKPVEACELVSARNKAWPRSILANHPILFHKIVQPVLEKTPPTTQRLKTGTAQEINWQAVYSLVRHLYKLSQRTESQDPRTRAKETILDRDPQFL